MLEHSSVRDDGLADGPCGGRGGVIHRWVTVRIVWNQQVVDQICTSSNALVAWLKGVDRLRGAA